MDKKHLIAVCDILGFRSLFDSKMFSLNWLYNRMGHISSSIGHSVYKDFDPPPKNLKDLRRICKIGVAWFSDTVLLFTKEDTDEQVVELINCVGYLISDNMKFKETRLRAGVAYGEAMMDYKNDIYLGKALIEAYELEQKQKWAGGAITKSAERRIMPIQNELIHNWLIKYDVPIEDNESAKLYAINWTKKPKHQKFIRWKDGREQPTPEEELAKKDIVLKWRNTNKFHNDVCSVCKK